MERKEDEVLEPFFESPRQWHFDGLLERVKISRSQLSLWLKKLEENNLIIRTKPSGKMPYYTHNFENPKFRNRKRLFGLKKLYESGLLNHLSSLEGANLVILFGSYSRSNWYEDSDIDIFIYGNDDKLELGKYQLKLKKEIQLFNARNKEDLKKLGSNLLLNIMEGFILKGTLNQLGVKLNF